MFPLLSILGFYLSTRLYVHACVCVCLWLEIKHIIRFCLLQMADSRIRPWYVLLWTFSLYLYGFPWTHEWIRGEKKTTFLCQQRIPNKNVPSVHTHTYVLLSSFESGIDRKKNIFDPTLQIETASIHTLVQCKQI